MRRLAAVTLLLLSALPLPALAHQERLAGGEWVLSGESGKRAPAIRFEGGRVAGTGGCNRFGGSYRHDGEALSFSPLAVTRIACPAEIMQKEQAFLAMLVKVKAVSLAENRMEMKDGEGKVLAHFVRRVAD